MTKSRNEKLSCAHVGAVKEELLALFSDAILVCDQDQIIVYANQGAATLFGAEEADLVGQPVSSLVPEPWRSRHGELMHQFAQNQSVSRDMRRRLPVLCRRMDGVTVKAAGTIAHVTLDGENYFGVILRDLTETEKTLHILAEKERLLEQALTKAQIAEQARSNFLATMSHELRTPLNAILGFSELILNRDAANAALSRIDYIRDIHNSGLKLLDLVEEILEFTSLRSDVTRLDVQPNQLEDLLHAAIAGIKPALAARDIHVDVTLEGNPMVQVDRLKMTEAFRQILENAVKFSPPGSLVCVEAKTQQDGQVAVSFRDNGIGMAAADIERLQAPFERAEASSVRRFEGVGLGLAITKAIAEMHGARLDISSLLGHGTTVTVLLPTNCILGSPPGKANDTSTSQHTESSPKASFAKRNEGRDSYWK